VGVRLRRGARHQRPGLGPLRLLLRRLVGTLRQRGLRRRALLLPLRQPPATLAEFTIGGGGGAHDYYDISVVDGYNLPMDFSCSSGAGLQCRGSGCPDGYLFPTDDSKTHACEGNSNYQVTFCP
jgi:hypothetical protein